MDEVEAKKDTLDQTQILMMLFQEHHRQLTDKRQKIHSVTERTLAIYLIIGGWLIIVKDPILPGMRWIIIGVTIVLAIWSCMSIYTNNRSYYTIALVVRRLNEALGLFDTGNFLPSESIYPATWKRFGDRGIVKGALFHICAILAGLGLCIVAAYKRA